MRISDWSSDVCSSDLSDTDAVNVAQLNKATASAVHYDVNSDGSINYNSVSFGDPSGTGGPVSLPNVAAGTAPYDAVNGEQLIAVRDHVLHRQQEYRDETHGSIDAEQNGRADD